LNILKISSGYYRQQLLLQQELGIAFQDRKVYEFEKKKFKIWIECISDENLNTYFDAKKEIEYEALTPKEAIGFIEANAAKLIFKENPNLPSFQLLCYYETLPSTIALKVAEIFNKPASIEAGLLDNNTFSSPVFFEKDFIVDIEYVIPDESPIKITNK
jgi:hypothetical protein